ncbi:hypothetical protein X777_15563 [Ooceraea biroi]|uniref:Uncharacterized protein n=1 Tax=Ooceraea biroi TaxID=2015173 RepID=A0A026VV68_OOCBI|nr:hypothetical protein X777_15563 [Ooceraea biroi]
MHFLHTLLIHPQSFLDRMHAWSCYIGSCTSYRSTTRVIVHPVIVIHTAVMHNMPHTIVILRKRTVRIASEKDCITT